MEVLFEDDLEFPDSGSTFPDPDDESGVVESVGGTEVVFAFEGTKGTDAGFKVDLIGVLAAVVRFGIGIS